MGRLSFTLFLIICLSASFAQAEQSVNADGPQLALFEAQESSQWGTWDDQDAHVDLFDENIQVAQNHDRISLDYLTPYLSVELSANLSRAPPTV